ncbi:MAG: DoxX family membrane protein [Patescibacteria group bacterium]
MNSSQKYALFALRITLGWMFFYAGITKVLDSSWSAAGYLAGAKSFPALFAWFASPSVIPVTNFLNAWGLTLLGVALLLGIAVRLSSMLGVLLMTLYYLTALDFPFPNAHSLLVDQHVIYSAALFVLATFHAGRVWGLEEWCSRLSFLKKYPKLREICIS